jgi:23S rRNA pseudouridine2605 synthase
MESSSSQTTVRLQKFLADAGFCSRRAAEELIASGQVTVNGKRPAPGTKVTPGVDKVSVQGEPIRTRRTGSVTLAVHKPRGLVCTNSDPHHNRTIFELIPPPYSSLRLFCAGRLDKESEGLVILTTDGELANRLMHPSGLVVKYYRVSLKEAFPGSDIPRLLKGVVFDEERLKVEKARLIGRGTVTKSTEVDVQMHHGKKREIRQLFTALGHDVKRLRRYQIGKFSMRGFPLRGVKLMTQSEIEQLLAVPTP